MSDAEDIFAAQPADEDALAELYDLEHDEIVEDRTFYRELARRSRGSVLDLGCGSGRLFGALLGARGRVVGIDPTRALVRRAQLRIAADPDLRAARREGRLEVRHGAFGAVAGTPRFGLIVVAGVLPHLGAATAARALLADAAKRLTRRGKLVLDDIGPGGLPDRDLPMTLDWRRQLDGLPVSRHSAIVREALPDGLEVRYSTLTETVRADGTIARLPASYRLWYPSLDALVKLATEAGLEVELAYGSYDLEPLGPDSERRILLLRRTASRRPATGTGPEGSSATG